MADVTVRPSLKFIKAGFIATALVIVAAIVAHFMFLAPQGQFPWLPIAAAALILWPLERMMRRQFIKITISGDKLYAQSGFLSKSTRIIQAPKIQDVRVAQSLGQRMFGVGDIAIETAGEASRLTLHNVDKPQELAEYILETANKGASLGHGI
jgi:uncharacterized membrane protein YdbT with pleckstrin-like domain